jgi:hypothetical protein
VVYWFVFGGFVALVIGLGLSVVVLFRFRWRNGEGKFRRLAQNISLSVFSILIILILLELFFYSFAQSDALGYTLASRNWFKRYWVKNSLGYRDVEWTPQRLEGRTKIMVVGDSFTAGYGIENKEDLFSYVLGQELGDEYAVMNLGRNGVNTEGAIENVRDYPYEPDIMILTIYINDIDGVAPNKGLPHPPALQVDVPALLAPLVENSYAANFFYWRMYRLGAKEWDNTYWNWLLSRYSDPEIWQAYEEQLLLINAYMKENNKKLIVVVFPHLTAIEKSQPITSKMVGLFTRRGVPVLDVASLVEGMDSDRLIVNAFDPHPSRFLHRLVGGELYKLVSDCQK